MRQVSRDFREKMIKYFHHLHKQELRETNQIHLVNEHLPENLKTNFQIELYQDILKSQPFILETFSSSFIDQLCQIVKEKIVGPEINILDQDKDSNSISFLTQRLYFILNGRVSLQIQQKMKSKIKVLERGDCIGLQEFITGQIKDLVPIFRCENEVIFAYIEKSEFMKLLDFNNADKEKFFMAKDKIQYSSQIQLMKQKCFSCEKTKHTFEECETVHFKMNREKIFFKNNFSQFQQRISTFQRHKEKKQSACIFFQIEEEGMENREQSIVEDQNSVLPITRNRVCHNYLNNSSNNQFGFKRNSQQLFQSQFSSSLSQNIKIIESPLNNNSQKIKKIMFGSQKSKKKLTLCSENEQESNDVMLHSHHLQKKKRSSEDFEIIEESPNQKGQKLSDKKSSHIVKQNSPKQMMLIQQPDSVEQQVLVARELNLTSKNSMYFQKDDIDEKFILLHDKKIGELTQPDLIDSTFPTHPATHYETAMPLLFKKSTNQTNGNQNSPKQDSYKNEQTNQIIHSEGAIINQNRQQSQSLSAFGSNKNLPKQRQWKSKQSLRDNSSSHITRLESLPTKRTQDNFDKDRFIDKNINSQYSTLEIIKQLQTDHNMQVPFENYQAQTDENLGEMIEVGWKEQELMMLNLLISLKEEKSCDIDLLKDYIYYFPSLNIEQIINILNKRLQNSIRKPKHPSKRTQKRSILQPIGKKFINFSQ